MLTSSSNVDSGGGEQRRQWRTFHEAPQAAQKPRAREQLDFLARRSLSLLANGNDDDEDDDEAKFSTVNNRNANAYRRYTHETAAAYIRERSCDINGRRYKLHEPSGMLNTTREQKFGAHIHSLANQAALKRAKPHCDLSTAAVDDDDGHTPVAHLLARARVGAIACSTSMQTVAARQTADRQPVCATHARARSALLMRRRQPPSSCRRRRRTQRTRDRSTIADVMQRIL